MSKFYRILEIVFSILLILIGSLMLYAGFEGISNKTSYSDDSYVFNLNKYQLRYLAKFHIPLILSFIAVLSGIFLLREKKIGGLFSLIYLFGMPTSILLLHLINPDSILQNPTSDIIETFTTIMIVCIHFALGFVLIMKRTFREKYNFNRKSLIILLSCLFLIIIDALTIVKSFIPTRFE